MAGYYEICPVCFSNASFRLSDYDPEQESNESPIHGTILNSDLISSFYKKTNGCNICHTMFSIPEISAIRKIMKKIHERGIERENLNSFCYSMVFDNDLNIEIRQTSVLFITYMKIIHSLENINLLTILENVAIKLHIFEISKEISFSHLYELICPYCFIDGYYSLDSYQTENDSDLSDIKTVSVIFNEIINFDRSFFICKKCNRNISWKTMVGSGLVLELFKINKVSRENFQKFCFDLITKITKSAENYFTADCICHCAVYFINDISKLQELKSLINPSYERIIDFRIKKIVKS